MPLKYFYVDSGPSKLFHRTWEMSHPLRILIMQCNHEDQSVAPRPTCFTYTENPSSKEDGDRASTGLAAFQPEKIQPTGSGETLPQGKTEGHSTPSFDPQLYKLAYSHRHIGVHTLTYRDTCIHIKYMHKQIFKSYYPITIILPRNKNFTNKILHTSF